MSKFIAWLYDLEMRMAAGKLDPRRQSLLNNVEGRTLEVGVGTGQNLRFYQPDSWVVGIDPDPDMLGRAQTRVVEAAAPVHLMAAAGESLPFAAGAFDAVVVTLALCSVRSQDQVLREIHRVLKSGGKLHFMEHVRSPGPGWARFQDVVTPAWKKVASG